MFSTTAVGKRIATLRKERNMTQMELADLMGVSYQAVSNWERGNSMPDISKLPELAGIFGISIDELLGSASPLIRSAAENKMDAYLEENDVSVDELTEAAPILKPEQVDAAIKNVQVDSVKSLAGVAPFASGEKISKMVEDMVSAAWNTVNDKLQAKLADIPGRINLTINGHHFSNHREEQAEQQAADAMAHDDLDGIEALAPYLSEAALGKIARQFIAEGRSIAGLAPHMDEEDVAACAKELAGQGRSISDIVSFMDEDDVAACAEMLTGQGRNISDLLPFMDEDDVGQRALELARQNRSIADMLPFMDEDDVAECAALLLSQGRNITDMLPFMDEDDIGDLAREAYEKDGVSAIVTMAPFMDSDTLQEIAEDALEKHGYKAILPLAPFLD